MDEFPDLPERPTAADRYPVPDPLQPPPDLEPADAASRYEEPDAEPGEDPQPAPSQPDPAPSTRDNSLDWLSDNLPWPDGAALLAELRDALCRYVIFPSPETADAATLWIAATHGVDAFEHAPRLAAISPEKRCGKSRLVDVAEATSNRSTVTINISTAALAREITEDEPPALFIDEADTIFGPKAIGDHEDLRGIVNSGHQRGRPYIRYNVNTRQNERLPTFAMAMLAGIGDLPDTIMDRSVVIRMRRRAPGERVDPYRTRRDRPALHDLRDRIHAWVRTNLYELQTAVPAMPVEDRAADTWEPLIAIADLAGGEWPHRARDAALKLVAAEDKIDIEASIGARLLADVRDVFDELPGVSFLASSQLVERLLKIPESPWREVGRDGLSPRGLASRLAPYGVRPHHNAAKTVRGYRWDDFADAFSRYIPSAPVQLSGQGSDLRKEPDTSGFRTRPANRPDDATDTCEDGSENANRPPSDLGKHPVSDGWTGRDGYPREGDRRCDHHADRPGRLDPRTGGYGCAECAPGPWGGGHGE